jgi:hypothetical protein
MTNYRLEYSKKKKKKYILNTLQNESRSIGFKKIAV